MYVAYHISSEEIDIKATIHEDGSLVIENRKVRTEKKFTKTHVANFFAKIRMMVVPLDHEGELGFDGTSYELTIGMGLNSVTYRWWIELPATWAQLEAITKYIDKLTD